MKINCGLKLQLLTILAGLVLAGATAADAATSVPVPYVDLISPIGAIPGGASFTLTLNGVGFVSGAVVDWKVGTTTTPLKTTYINGRTLKAYVPANLIFAAETAILTVANPAPIAASNPTYFPIHEPYLSPTTSTDYAVGGFSTLFNRPIGVADFDGDGILDLVVGNAGDNTVWIMKGLPGGSFMHISTLPVGMTPTMIAVGDFNNDGLPDFAVTSWDDAHVYVYTGSGPDTFTLQPIITVTCCLAWVGTADFNRDGNLDLAMAVINGSTGWVQVLSGDGTGSFAAPGVIVNIPGAGAQPTAVAIGDFNADNRLDLAVTDVIRSEVHILKGGTTPGMFTYGEVLSTEHNPAPVALGDFDNDGVLDIAVSNLYENSVSIFPGIGDATFSTPVTFAADSGPFAILAGNFDGNQKMDLIVGNHFGNSARIWHNASTGVGSFAFTAGSIAPSGDGPTFVAIGDCNNDGELDYVTGSEYADTITVGLP